MIDQINELPEDGLESSPETPHYTENKWICRKNHNKLYFLHLVDILNDLLLIVKHSNAVSSNAKLSFSFATRKRTFFMATVKRTFFINKINLIAIHDLLLHIFYKSVSISNKLNSKFNI